MVCLDKLGPRPDGEVKTRVSAKHLCAGLIPAPASMKKLALFLAVLGIFSYVFCSKVFGQILTFDRAYQDYQYNLTVYNQAFQDFEDAKNAYLANQTLALKETARQKTYTMLVDRDTLMAVYLTAVRTKISELTGLSSDEKNNIFGKIDPEVIFYTNHKSSYGSGDSLDQLFATSSQSQNQYTTKTNLVVQEALFDISLGQLAGLRINHEQIFTFLNSMIDSGVAAGKLTRDPFSRWLTDIDATDQTLKQNEATAMTQIAQIYSQSYGLGGGYDAAITTLSQNVTGLNQYNEFLSEVLNYILSHE